MLVNWGISIRRACKALKFDTSTYHYKSRRTGQAALERRIKEICETRVRYGYRHLHVLLRREGSTINMKKTRRIYNELGLQLRTSMLEIGFQTLLRIEFRAITGQVKQLDLVLPFRHPRIHGFAVMDTQVIEDQEHLPAGVLDQGYQKLDQPV
jgi:hypothetical protein